MVQHRWLWLVMFRRAVDRLTGGGSAADLMGGVVTHIVGHKKIQPAISIVVEPCGPRPQRSSRRSSDRTSVQQEDVEPTVTIVVPEGAAGAERLGDALLASGPVRVPEMDAGLSSNVGECRNEQRDTRKVHVARLSR